MIKNVLNVRYIYAISTEPSIRLLDEQSRQVDGQKFGGRVQFDTFSVFVTGICCAEKSCFYAKEVIVDNQLLRNAFFSVVVHLVPLFV